VEPLPASGLAPAPGGALTELAVFGYGSLADPASAAITLGRDVEVIGSARLAGWRRRWSVMRDNRATEKCFARELDGSIPAHCIGLNLERVEGEPGANGVLLSVKESDLERLDLREMRYERTDVSADVRVTSGEAASRVVVAYTARPENYAPEPPEDAILIASYVRAVETAFEALGELEEFRATTDEPPVDVVEAVLVEDAIPEGNPRDW
jgi:cation transport regulator ChaC